MGTNEPVPATEAGGGGHHPDARQLRTILIAVFIALRAVTRRCPGASEVGHQLGVFGTTPGPDPAVR
ncbi:hypothetical protein SATRM34S_00309 [Streptomyces atroolivaceus]